MGRLHATVVAKATFGLRHGAEMSLLEPVAVVDGDRHRDDGDLEQAGELAPYLSYTDVLVGGHVYAPPGRSVPVVVARIQLRGPCTLLDKSLNAHGDRASGQPLTAAAPFRKVALSYRHAQAGEANPVGLRDRPPNLSVPSTPTRPIDPGFPAGFGAIAGAWPLRHNRLPKAAHELLAKEVMEIPPGFDWAYFQAAPPDQRVGFLAGDEWLTLEGLHPAMMQVQTRLPRARLEVRLWPTQHRVAMNADMLIIDTDAQSCSLVWRGSFPVGDQRVVDRVQLAAALSLAGQPFDWDDLDHPEDQRTTALLIDTKGVLRINDEPSESTHRMTRAAKGPPPLPVDSPLPSSAIAEGRVAITPQAPQAPQAPMDSTIQGTIPQELRELLARAKKRPPASLDGTLASALPDAGPATPFEGSAPKPAPPSASGELPRGNPLESTAAITPTSSSRAATPFETAPTERVEKPEAPTERLKPVAQVPLEGTAALGTVTAAMVPGAEREQAAPFPLADAAAAPVTLRPASLPGAPWSMAPMAAVVAPSASLQSTFVLRPERAEGDDAPATSEGYALVNPTTVNLATLPWQLEPGRTTLTFIAKGTFDLVGNGPAAARNVSDPPCGELPIDLAAPTPAPDNMSISYGGDFAFIKPRADVTVVGSANSAEPVAAMDVRFEFGDQIDRRIAVFGERVWDKRVVGDRIGAPAQFTSMPLIYERAFGGPGCPNNPVGIGANARSLDAALLPNLEDPNDRIDNTASTPNAACFAPLPCTWSQRWNRLGTFDDAWLDQRWPFLPDDFDAKFFQAAPPQQQLDLVHGDEAFAFTGMRKDEPRFQGTLPGKRLRLFYEKVGGPFTELPMRLDTVAFDLDALSVQLVWRGLLDVVDDRGSDLDGLFVCLEPLGDEAAPDQLERTYRAHRTELQPLADHPNGAPGAANSDAQSDGQGDAVESDAITARLASLAALEAVDDPVAFLTPAPIDPAAMSLRMREAGATDGDIEAALASADTPTLKSAQADALPQRGADEVERVIDHAKRGAVERQLAAGEPIGRNLSGADLSRLDLSGQSLPACDLTGARLAGTNLSGADLAGAQLSDADLSDALLTGANLSRCDLRNAALYRCNLSQATLDDADLTSAKGSAAVFRGCKGKRVRFCEGQWLYTDFEGSDLPDADFTDALLSRANFGGSTIPRIRLYDARGSAPCFDGADLTAARADASILPKARFANAHANESTWEGAVLDQASFFAARLDEASFVRASLSDAILSRATLRGGRLDGANLNGSSALRTDFMGASLQAADLRGADLRGANLFRADTWQARLDKARLDGANVGDTKLEGSDASLQSPKS